MRNIFIAELSKENQKKIEGMVRNYLIKENYDQEKIEEIIFNVLNDRLCNLEEFFDIEPFLYKGKIINIA